MDQHLAILMFALQRLIRDWQQPAAFKFIVVEASVTALLLASYQVLVRRTTLGWLLNGPCHEIKIKLHVLLLQTDRLSLFRLRV